LTEVTDWLSSTLGYRFVDERLLVQALTHRSAGGVNNERLEFLGDAVLGLVVAQSLFRLKPDADEGGLSRYRSRLVRKETLAQIAREIDLGGRLQMGAGEHRTGGHQRSSVLADALEPILGAILLDGGFTVTSEVITRLYAERLDNLPDEAELVDAKTSLQEYLQARGLPPPVYELLDATGAPHARTFRSRCLIAGLDLETTGSGRSRRRAEQSAAALAMERLGSE
jgi:ribonuclease-3